MNTQYEDQDTVQTSAHNAFPEPQTIPSGWDTSGFLSTPPLVSDEQDDNLTQRESE